MQQDGLLFNGVMAVIAEMYRHFLLGTQHVGNCSQMVWLLLMLAMM